MSASLLRVGLMSASWALALLVASVSAHAGADPCWEVGCTESQVLADHDKDRAAFPRPGHLDLVDRWAAEGELVVTRSASRKLMQAQSGITANADPSYQQIFNSLKPRNASGSLCTDGGTEAQGVYTCTNTQPIGLTGEDAFYFNVPDAGNGNDTKSVEIKVVSVAGDADLQVFTSHALEVKESRHSSVNDYVYFGQGDLLLGTQLLIVVTALYESQYTLTITTHDAEKKLDPTDRAAVNTILNTCCGVNANCPPELTAAFQDTSDHRVCGEGGSFVGSHCNRDGRLVRMSMVSWNLDCNVSDLAPLRNLTHLEAIDIAYMPNLKGDLNDLMNIFSLEESRLGHMVLVSLPGLNGTLNSVCNTNLVDIMIEGHYEGPIGKGLLPACLFEQLKVLYLKDTHIGGGIAIPKHSQLREIALIQTAIPQADRVGGENLDMTLSDSVRAVTVLDTPYNGYVAVSGPVVAVHVMNVQVTAISVPEVSHIRVFQAFNTQVANNLLGVLSKAPKISRLEVVGGRLSHMPRDWTTPRLRMLRLRGNLLEGELQPSIAALGALHMLDLSSNKIMGTLIPFTNAIPSPSPLVHFNVANNLLEGEIPKHLSKLGTYDQWVLFAGTPINLVNLSGNVLKGAIPAEVLTAPGRVATLRIDFSNNTGLECPKAESGPGWVLYCDQGPPQVTGRGLPHGQPVDSDEDTTNGLDDTLIGTPVRSGNSLGEAFAWSFGIAGAAALAIVGVGFWQRRKYMKSHKGDFGSGRFLNYADVSGFESASMDPTPNQEIQMQAPAQPVQ